MTEQERFDDLLEKKLAGELTPVEESVWQRLLDSNSDFQDQWKEEELLAETFANMREVKAPTGFADQVMEEVSAPAQPSPAPRWNRYLPVAAAAAVVVVAGMTAYYQRGDDQASLPSSKSIAESRAPQAPSEDSPGDLTTRSDLAERETTASDPIGDELSLQRAHGPKKTPAKSPADAAPAPGSLSESAPHSVPSRSEALDTEPSGGGQQDGYPTKAGANRMGRELPTPGGIAAEKKEEGREQYWSTLDSTSSEVTGESGEKPVPPTPKVLANQAAAFNYIDQNKGRLLIDAPDRQVIDSLYSELASASSEEEGQRYMLVQIPREGDSPEAGGPVSREIMSNAAEWNPEISALQYRSLDEMSKDEEDDSENARARRLKTHEQKIKLMITKRRVSEEERKNDPWAVFETWIKHSNATVIPPEDYPQQIKTLIPPERESRVICFEKIDQASKFFQAISQMDTSELNIDASDLVYVEIEGVPYIIAPAPLAEGE